MRRDGGKQTVIDGDTDGHTGQRRCVLVLAGLCQKDGVTHQHLYQNGRQLKCLMLYIDIFKKSRKTEKKSEWVDETSLLPMYLKLLSGYI